MTLRLVELSYLLVSLTPTRGGCDATYTLSSFSSFIRLTPTRGDCDAIKPINPSIIPVSLTPTRGDCDVFHMQIITSLLIV